MTSGSQMVALPLRLSWQVVHRMEDGRRMTKTALKYGFRSHSRKTKSEYNVNIWHVLERDAEYEDDGAHPVAINAEPSSSRPSIINERTFSQRCISLSLSMKGETKNRNHNTYNDYSSLELLWLPRLVLLLGPRLAKSNWKIWEMGYESPN